MLVEEHYQHWADTDWTDIRIFCEGVCSKRKTRATMQVILVI